MHDVTTEELSFK